MSTTTTTTKVFTTNRPFAAGLKPFDVAIEKRTEKRKVSKKETVIIDGQSVERTVKGADGKPVMIDGVVEYGRFAFGLNPGEAADLFAVVVRIRESKASGAGLALLEDGYEEFTEGLFGDFQKWTQNPNNDPTDAEQATKELYRLFEVAEPKSKRLPKAADLAATLAALSEESLKLMAAFISGKTESAADLEALGFKSKSELAVRVQEINNRTAAIQASLAERRKRSEVAAAKKAAEAPKK